MLVKSHTIWNDLSDVQNQFDRFFHWGKAGGAAGYYPPVNISETEDAYVVEARVPGLGNDEVTVELENKILTIKGEHKRDQVTYGREERASGKFERVITFKKPLKADGVDAHVQNGILAITLPKAEESKPRKITVAMK
jgi:HSP20 family protein